VGESSPAVQPRGFGATSRTDAWWIGPLATALGLGAFVVYSTARAIANTHYEHDNLLSPFFSPNLTHALGLPNWISPAFLILWAPGGFRLTCYYYRKAYYRAFFADPPACAVGEARKEYCGESKFPFILQNLHRYFLYFAIVILFILWYDVWQALWFNGKLGVSVGTLVLGANSLFLTLYTLSCHSLRHLVGGRVDCFSCVALGGARHSAWKGLSRLNEHHMLWAWVSLFGVGFADFYVWMVASGTFRDMRIL